MKRILLIDDDGVTNVVNKKLIELTGMVCEISVAHHGQHALELIHKNNTNTQLPDIILLDIHMPVMGGFQFLKRLHELASVHIHGTKIAIVSSSDNIEDKIKAREFGVAHYFVKPTTLDQLKRILE